MNRILSKVFIGVYFLPLLFMLCSIENVGGQSLFLQTIGNENVFAGSKKVQLKIHASKKGATYLLQNGSSLLDSLEGTGEESQFTFPVSALQVGDNVLQVTEKSPGLYRMSKVTVKLTGEHPKSEGSPIEQSEERPLEVAEVALVYPNPTTSFFVVNSEQPVEKLEIYSPTGEMSKAITEKVTGEIPIEELPDGIYTIRIFYGRNVKETKLVKY